MQAFRAMPACSTPDRDVRGDRRQQRLGIRPAAGGRQTSRRHLAYQPRPLVGSPSRGSSAAAAACVRTAVRERVLGRGRPMISTVAVAHGRARLSSVSETGRVVSPARLMNTRWPTASTTRGARGAPAVRERGDPKPIFFVLLWELHPRRGCRPEPGPHRLFSGNPPSVNPGWAQILGRPETSSRVGVRRDRCRGRGDAQTGAAER
jgi:hypothetical protein